eukprot:Gb_03550 [translate_table: standard]
MVTMTTLVMAPLCLSQHQHQSHLLNTCSRLIQPNNNRMQCQMLLFEDVGTIHRTTKSCFLSIIEAAATGTRTGTFPLKGELEKTYGHTYMATELINLCREGQLKKALKVLRVMDLEGNIPVDPRIYDSLLQACSHTKALEEGKQVHAHMRLTRFDQDDKLRTKLLKMYLNCGCLDDARLVFDETSKPNSFLWNAMIRGYVIKGFYEEEVLTLYRQMILSGVKPDIFTFTNVLKACGSLSDLEQGKEVHTLIIRSGYESDVCVGSALLDMYSKCGSIDSAYKVFDNISQRNVITWSAMISGLAHSNRWVKALECFRQMQIEGCKANSVTVAAVLPACGMLGDLQQGREIHGYIIRNEFDSYGFVDSALIDMYSKCKNIEVAYRVFYKMSERNVITWATMIAGCTHNGYANEALEIFRQMERDGVKPNPGTMASVLRACGDLAVLQQGKEIHAYILRSGLKSNAFVCSSLIDMYAKCGSIEAAHHVFDKISEKNVFSWNAMIAGYGMNGYGKSALTLFHQMQQENMKPMHSTFLAVLSACSHAGLVAEGMQCFDCMTQIFHIKPGVEHYACMVGLLGCSGQLKEAWNFIQNMPFEADAAVWGALLSACRIHCNIEIAEHAAQQLFELEPANAANYVLLSNIYGLAGRWNDATKVRTKMKERGLQTRPGYSWIEVKNRLHTFIVGDKSHPQLKKIYAMLKSLAGQMEAAGYVPDAKFVLHNVAEQDNEFILCGHTEKLAIAFGLITTCPEIPIRINKNLRVCGDCHSATKSISKIVRRTIIVRDADHIHHFKGGKCSCGDYW